MSEQPATSSTEHLKKVRTIGSLVIWVSGFVLFSNSMGILAYWFVNGGARGRHGSEAAGSSARDPLSFVWQHYVELGIAMVLVGVALMVSGIFFKKRRLWANRLLSFLIVLLVAIVWLTMMVLHSSMALDRMVSVASFFPYLVALAWTTPLLLLLRLINRKGILIHFDRPVH